MDEITQGKTWDDEKAQDGTLMKLQEEEGEVGR